jgi:hypothetical protein
MMRARWSISEDSSRCAEARRSCRTACRLSRKVWSAGRASAFSAWNWLICALRLASSVDRRSTSLLEEVERAFGAPGPQLHIGGDDPGDVFVDHIGGDLTRARLEAHGDDRGLVAAAAALDRGHLLHLRRRRRRASVECSRRRRTRWRCSSRLARVSSRSRMIVISSSADVVTVTSTRSSEICGDSTKSRASVS